MDEVRPRGEESDRHACDGALDDRPPEVAFDERRMHVRAYNHWMSLLAGRAYPSIADLDPAGMADFGPHAVLLDFSGRGDPAIAYLGGRLARACGLDRAVSRIADVPARSLLDRLTSQYRDILANRAPIGFEAEFVDAGDATMLYRGILMPFSSDGERIDFVYGVMNWKALADPADAGGFADTAFAAAPAVSVPFPAEVPVWADGPGGRLSEAPAPARPDSFAERIEVARAGARRAGRAEVHARATRHHAIGLAYDLLLEAEAGPGVLPASGREEAPSPARALAELVFAGTADEKRVREFADALAHARRAGVPAGGFASYADALRGGVRAMVVAERAIGA